MSAGSVPRQRFNPCESGGAMDDDLGMGSISHGESIEMLSLKVRKDLIIGFRRLLTASKSEDPIDWATACDNEGVSFKRFRLTRLYNPEFDDECRFCELEAAERVVGVVRRKAINGDMRAIKTLGELIPPDTRLIAPNSQSSDAGVVSSPRLSASERQHQKLLSKEDTAHITRLASIPDQERQQMARILDATEKVMSNFPVKPDGCEESPEYREVEESPVKSNDEGDVQW